MSKRADEDENKRDPPEIEKADQSGDTGRTPSSRYFRFVIQQRESRQMDVLRWLESDECYDLVYILHDCDVRQNDNQGADSSQDDTDPDSKTDEIDDDGRIKPHYHGIVRTKKKVTAMTMTKRFGGYVHFQIAGDPFDYARYLTHECFRARNKHKYRRSDVKGNHDFYIELLNDSDLRAFECVSDWASLMAENEHDHKKALASAVTQGDKRLIKSIMSHSYFYKEFF